MVMHEGNVCMLVQAHITIDIMADKQACVSQHMTWLFAHCQHMPTSSNVLDKGWTRKPRSLFYEMKVFTQG